MAPEELSVISGFDILHKTRTDVSAGDDRSHIQAYIIGEPERS
jgi:hypothetical protein